MSEVVILANGDFPVNPLPLSILKNTEKVICCDGAVKGLLEISVDPAAIVGDLDSITPDIRDKYAQIIHKSDDQETNDLSKAFLFSLGLNPEKIVILGATGKREDHTLGNISLLSDFSRLTDIPIEMYTDFGLFIPVSKSSSFDFQTGRQISVFSLTPEIRIKSNGLKYPVDNVIFDSWWKATLNEVEQSPFTLEFKTGGRVIIYAAY
jgi:thiamine pyrophosphokinase